MAKSPPTARSAAIYLLDQILGQKRLMSNLLDEKALMDLAPPDRARAQRLVMDTLRGLERADRLISRHLRKPPALTVRNALRLGTVELCQGGDAHGVVSDIVTIIANDSRVMRQKGLVNAILRQIAETGPRSWDDLRIPRLPDWLRRQLVKSYGSGAVNAMEKAHFTGAPVDLTARENSADVANQVGGDLLPTGSIRLNTHGQISNLPGYDQGLWWVQDAAAALPVQILTPQPGENILDLCAAPGGKTMQLAAAGAAVTALDLSRHRMSRVAENLIRTGLKATCLVEDALKHKGGPYDAVLLDAPCSATGTIRRHPDLPYTKTNHDLKVLTKLQTQMLDHAITLLKPGGRMVFCTCSLLPEEGETQIASALDRHSALRIDERSYGKPGIDPAWKTQEGGLRLRPDYWPAQGGMDGFYMASLIYDG